MTTSTIVDEKAKVLIELCKYLEIKVWLNIVAYLNKNGGPDRETDNFSFKEWFGFWLVRQNDVLYQKDGAYFTEQGFYELSQVIPEAPVFEDATEIKEVMKSLMKKGFVGMVGKGKKNGTEI